MAIHIGSWGTPELGLTELFQKITGIGGTTKEGGSDVSASMGTSTVNNPQSDYSQTFTDMYSTPATSQMSLAPAMSYPQQTSVTTNTGGGGGGGGSSGIDLSNPVKRTEYAHSLGYDSWDQYINANQQQAPQQPSFEDLYGDAFRQAFEAVNQMQGAIQNVYRDWETDRKSTRLNSSHSAKSRMPSSA